MSQQINLFNPALRKQKQYFSADAMAKGLGLVLAGMLAISAFAAFQLKQMNKAVDDTGNRLALVQAQLDKMGGAGPKQKSKALEEQIQQADAEVTALQQAYDTLQKGDFGNTKGYSEYMRAFSRQILDGIWLTGFSIHGAGNEIAIQGRAVQASLVPAYIGRLKHESVMRGKSFEMLEMHTPEVEQPAKDGQPAKSAPAGYIEFSLQSEGMPAAQTGAKEK